MRSRTRSSRKGSSRIGYKKKKRSKLVVALILLAFVCILVVLGILYYSNLNVYKFKESAVMYINGIAYYISDGDRAVLDNDIVTITRSESTDLTINELPVYFSDSRSVLLVCPMAYYRAGQMGGLHATQLHPLTVVESEYENVNISRKHKYKSEQGDFLFDGTDTYVALRSCQLKIGDSEPIKLSPLSYVQCDYNSYVMYWDHDTDSFDYIIFEVNEDSPVELYFEDEDLTVQCSLDRLQQGDESCMLSQAISMLSETLK